MAATAVLARPREAAAFPLSPLQQGMLFNSLYAADAGRDLEQMVIDLREAVDLPALEAAWRRAAGRHEILRSAFRWEGVDRPVQVPADGVELPWEAHDWRGVDAAEQEARLDAWLDADRARGMDLRRAPLHRVAAFHLADGHLRLVWSFHHALLDGRGMVIVLREVSAFYAAALRGESIDLPLPRPFADHVAWLDARDGAAAGPFWRDLLAGYTEPAVLPACHARPAVPGQRDAEHTVLLSREASDALRDAVRARGLTLNTVVQGAWGIALGRWCGRDDVVFGTVRGGRRSSVEGADGMVGPVFNTVPVRARLRADATLLEYLEELRRQHVDVRPWEHTPAAEVRRWAELPAGAPLFDTLAVFESRRVHLMLRDGDPDWATREVRFVRRTGYPVSLTAHGEEQVRLCAVYDPCRFTDAAMGRLLGHVARVLAQFTADPAVRLGALEVMDDGERRRLAAWAGAEPAAPAVCVHRVVEAHAARTPDVTALEWVGGSMTYGELDARANRLARLLVRRGVRPGDRVALMVESSPEMIVGQLAAWKAGAAYLPLDPATPAERAAFVLRDAGASVLLARAARAATLPASGIDVVPVDDLGGMAEGEVDAPLGMETDSRAAAYVIYTSGSTGTPKGVEVEHAQLANLVGWHLRAFGLGAADRCTQLAGVGFDACAWETWPVLAAGAALHLVDDDTRLSPPALQRLLIDHRITVSFASTPLAEALLRLSWPADAALRVLLTGGDALRVRPAADLPFRLVNAYGPTECTVVATAGPVAGEDADGRAPSIGGAIGGARAWVVDVALRLVPASVPGELCVGGAGVARGYVGRPALTAERFVPDPYSEEPGGRMYRTGDRVRWLADGSLEFLGRLDHQVKVRGVRIEPGEVEAALLALPGVRAAVAAVRPDSRGEARLLAWVEADGSIDAAGMREALRRTLPEAMVPSAVVVLDAFPLTLNGKVDRARLPEPGPAAASAPSRALTPAEEILAGIWAEVLGAAPASPEDDFFALGGHSLLATRVVSRVREAFGAELPLRAVFEASTLADLAARAEAARRGGAPRRLPALAAGPREGEAPASYAQRGLWLLDRLRAEGAAYTVPAAVRLSGALDAGALHRALRELVRRHESLRTVFAERDGEPVQVIIPAGNVTVAVDDLSALPIEAREAEVQRRAAQAARARFDLSRGPLFRAALLCLAADEHVLLLTLHHAVSDGWSMEVLFRELSALYGAFAAGLPSPLAEPALQYADFARWQREHLSALFDEQEAWWARALAGAPAVLDLPADRPRPAVRDGRGARARMELSAGTTAALEALARRQGATPFMVLLAGFQALLGRLCGTTEVVVGTPTAGRGDCALEGLIGFFVNPVALRADLSGDPTFGELVERTRDRALAAWDRQELPFERVARAAGADPAAPHAPVFQVMFALQNAPAVSSSLGELGMEPVEHAWEAAKYDLTVQWHPSADGLRGTIDYATDLFDGATVRALAARYLRLLDAAALDPAQPLSGLPLVRADERARVLYGWNATSRAYPRARSVHALFAAQADRTPDAPALTARGRTLTYAELDARANRLARVLRGRGVGPESAVGVCIERSAELIVALLAVLKAGGAYVPLDPSYPASRLAGMLEDSGAVRVLAGRREAASLPAGLDVLVLEDALAEAENESAAALADGTGPDGLAYVLFTSGSTGRPKGVAVPHRAVVRLVRGAAWLDFGSGETFLQYAPVSFDAATLEIWGPLLNGGRLAVAPAGALSLAELGRVVREEGVTTLWLTAGLFHQVVDHGVDDLRGVRQLLAGGDVLSPAHVRRALQAIPGIRLINGYGPTENTTFSAVHAIGAADLANGAGAVPIGRPIDNTTAFVLDASMAPLPPGVPGELFVGGDGLARGYAGQPARTAATFVPHPFGHGERLYRTGDRARWRADGTLEFLGRVDHQVKIRGFRVEPGEIEAALRAHPAVRAAAVVVRGEGGEKRLAGYAAADGVDHSALREHLRARLPGYMVPAWLVVMDALPLNAVGKVDRARLPDPEPAEEADAFVAPRTATETKVAGIWREVLHRERVGVHDDFFLLGGHSLSVTRVMARIRDAFSVDVPLQALFDGPTVAALAAVLDAAVPPAPAAAEPPLLRRRGAAPTVPVDQLSEDQLDALLGRLTTPAS
jgi:amino acid adenylation domain-containing protein